MPDKNNDSNNDKENEPEGKINKVDNLAALRPKAPKQTRIIEPSAQLLKNKYNLHKSKEVTESIKRQKAKTGEKVSQNPLEQIQTYLDRFYEISDRQDPEKRQHGINAIKRLIHSNFVIKTEEIPESYWDTQKRIAREQGHGNIEITEKMKQELSVPIIADQEASIDAWVDYMFSPDAFYPDCLKYFTIRNVLNLSEYDKEKKVYPNRSKGTTKPFPSLNQEALAYVLDGLDKKYKKENIDLENLETEEKEKFEKLLQTENFAKLYAWATEKVTPEDLGGLQNIKGEWIKYNKDSDAKPLVASLQGYGTGWCTAGESTAQAQLRHGDFYVYYSLDKTGKPSVPRIAIRMSGDKIGEVRGVALGQNLDPYITPVIEEKLKEFPDGDLYKKKVANMKMLTEIDKKTAASIELTVQDLIFLYELDNKIIGFGFGFESKDPRIYEIRTKRNTEKDLNIIAEIPKYKNHEWVEKNLKIKEILHKVGVIEEKVNENEALSPDELFFIYQVDSNIIDYRDLPDPRVIKLTAGRDIGQDILAMASDAKYKDHPWIEKCIKIKKDLDHLKLIEEKIEQDQKLSPEELLFIYQVDSKIIDFSGKPMEMDAVIKKRNFDQDINLLAHDPEFMDHPWVKRNFKINTDMKTLNEIETKASNNVGLSRGELKFIYQVDSIVTNFDEKEDPRIHNLTSKRDLKKDLQIIFECNDDQIAFSVDEVKKDSKVYIGPITVQLLKVIPLDINIYISTDISVEKRMRPERFNIEGLVNKEITDELDNVGITHYRDMIEYSKIKKYFNDTVPQDKEINIMRIKQADLPKYGPHSNSESYYVPYTVGLYYLTEHVKELESKGMFFTTKYGIVGSRINETHSWENNKIRIIHETMGGGVPTNENNTFIVKLN